MFDFAAGDASGIFFSHFSCTLIPFSIISTLQILVTFVQSRTALQQLTDVSVIGNSAASEAKLTKNLFVVWIAFFLCWLPITALLFIDPKVVIFLVTESILFSHSQIWWWANVETKQMHYCLEITKRKLSLVLNNMNRQSKNVTKFQAL